MGIYVTLRVVYAREFTANYSPGLRSIVNLNEYALSRGENEKQKRRLFLWLREWMLNWYAAGFIIPDTITHSPGIS